MIRSAFSVAALITLFAQVACSRNEPAPAAPPSSPAKNAQVAAPPATEAVAPGAAPVIVDAPAAAEPPPANRVPAVEFSTPRTVSLAKNAEVSFTIAEATIEPRNPESVRLVLLVRMHNKQRQAAEFADENFRLLTKNSVVPANGGLSETIGANSDSALERVQFTVPLGSDPRAVQVEYGGETVELSLAFK